MNKENIIETIKAMRTANDKAMAFCLKGEIVAQYEGRDYDEGVYNCKRSTLTMANRDLDIILSMVEKL